MRSVHPQPDCRCQWPARLSPCRRRTRRTPRSAARCCCARRERAELGLELPYCVPVMHDLFRRLATWRSWPTCPEGHAGGLATSPTSPARPVRRPCNAVADDAQEIEPAPNGNLCADTSKPNAAVRHRSRRPLGPDHYPTWRARRGRSQLSPTQNGSQRFYFSPEGLLTMRQTGWRSSCLSLPSRRRVFVAGRTRWFRCRRARSTRPADMLDRPRHHLRLYASSPVLRGTSFTICPWSETRLR